MPREPVRATPAAVSWNAWAWASKGDSTLEPNSVGSSSPPPGPPPVPPFPPVSEVSSVGSGMILTSSSTITLESRTWTGVAGRR